MRAERKKSTSFCARSASSICIAWCGTACGQVSKAIPSKSLSRSTGLRETQPSPMRTWRLPKFSHVLNWGISNSSMRTIADVVAGYNRDDCVSTWRLRDWLEARRADLVASGTAVPRPEAPEGAPTEALGEWQEKINALIERLTMTFLPMWRTERLSSMLAGFLHIRLIGTGANRRRYGGSISASPALRPRTCSTSALDFPVSHLWV